MPVIALIGNKGGAGKTTLCVNLAKAFALRKPTVVIDADPQQSSLQWSRMGDSHSDLKVASGFENLSQAIADIDPSIHYRLIDCPPSAQSPQMAQALEIADVAVIPVLPSPLDIWATVHVEEAIEKAKKTNPNLKVWLVVNQFESRTRLSRAAQDALGELELPAAKTLIRRRTVFRHSLIDGRTVHDLGVRGAEAAEEINQLIKEMEL